MKEPIHGYYVISDYDFERFNNASIGRIAELQADGQEVETQFRPVSHGGTLIYTVQITGRKAIENGNSES